jgi:hypothetical protein
MPFVGESYDTGDLVLPHDVAEDTLVQCPECGGAMQVRPSYWNQETHISRHFAHKSGGEGCGGESPVHLEMKAVAKSRLESQFDSGTVILEKEIAPDRIADIVVEFDNPLYRLGDGLAVEAQYQNKSKQKGQVTEEYLQHNYSVLWCWPADFDFENAIFEFDPDRVIPVWPNAISHNEGLSGYDEYFVELYEHLLQEDTTVDGQPGQVPATFPREVGAVHDIDVRNPCKEGRHLDWDEFGEISLHSEGNSPVWVSIFGHPDVGSFMEFREIDQSAGQKSRLPVPVAPSDVAKLQEFIEEGKQVFEEQLAGYGGGNDTDPDEQDRSKSILLNGIKLSYNAGLQGHIAMEGFHGDSPQFTITQHDIFGCERTQSIPYRSGDYGRLEPVPEIVQYVAPSKRPFQPV